MGVRRWKTRRDSGHAAPAPAGGFTLLEVLIAAMILAAGAAYVLGHLQALLDYASRAQAQQAAVRDLVNHSVILEHRDPDRFRRTGTTSDTLTLEMETETNAPVAIEVRNRGEQGQRVPVSIGFSPFQTFKLNPGARWQMTFLGPGLSPEGDR